MDEKFQQEIGKETPVRKIQIVQQRDVGGAFIAAGVPIKDKALARISRNAP
ncbi:MAG: hypothetical protein PHO46_06895 [Thermoguttaceae bacterium]|nr:hypothetical protein [Thermoguttaceae bacterium]